MAWLAAWLVRLTLVASLAVAALLVVGFSLSYPLMAALVAAGLLYRWRRGRVGGGWAMGTARTSSLLDLARGGMLSDQGLILGRCTFLEPPRRLQAALGLLSPWVASTIAVQQFAASWRLSRGGSDRIIRVKNYVHLATFSPTGGGKGISAVVPNLLAHDGSAVVLDPKGENFKLTAEHRSHAFGHRVVRLDPDGVCGPGGDAINALDFLDVHAANFADQCLDLADALIFRKGTEPDPHWTESARMVLAALIAWVRACEPDDSQRNLGLVHQIIASRHCFEHAVKEMQAVEGFGGVIARMGHIVGWYQEKELAGVLTTLNRNLAFLNSPAVQGSLSRSTFNPRDLRQGKLTIYLVVSPERLSTAAPLIRLWVGTLLREIARMGESEKHPVLFMLDEFAHIGRMQALEDAFTLMRGYGVRLWVFLQSIEQLHTVYGDKAPVILGNIGTQQFFGINAYESAEAISKRVGDFTILVKTLNKGGSSSRQTGGSTPGQQPGSTGSSHGSTTSEAGRRLYRPEEILTLRSDVALVFHKNMSVIPAKLLAYFSAPEFSRGGVGRNRRPGFLKSAALLALVLVVGRLAWLHVVPVAAAVLGRVTGVQWGIAGRRDSGASPGPVPRYRRAPVRQNYQPQPYYWQLPSGEWVYIYL